MCGSSPTGSGSPGVALKSNSRMTHGPRPPPRPGRVFMLLWYHNKVGWTTPRARCFAPSAPSERTVRSPWCRDRTHCHESHSSRMICTVPQHQGFAATVATYTIHAMYAISQKSDTCNNPDPLPSFLFSVGQKPNDWSNETKYFVIGAKPKEPMLVKRPLAGRSPKLLPSKGF